MKYLRTYEGYKKSNKFGDELTQEEWNKLFNKHCKMYDKNNIKIYRGFRRDEDLDSFDKGYVGYYQNPKGHKRKSIEPQQIHVTLMSELDSWKDFPPYNESIIGTNSMRQAKGYGIVYEIIPYDNSLIGVCPENTIWDSFGGFDEFDLIKRTHTFLTNWIDYKPEQSWSQVKNNILKMDIDKKFETYFPSPNDFIRYERFFNRLKYWDEHRDIKYKMVYIESEDIWNYAKTVTPEKIVEYIEFMFDPKERGFESLKYNEKFSENMKKIYKKNVLYKGEEDFFPINQFWCEGPILLRPI